MPITAHLEHPAGLPRDPRRKLRLEASGELATGDATPVLIHNVSATGLLLECKASLATGDRIGIDLPQAGPNWAKVVWASGALYGCEFEVPISTAALSAAQLRSAVGPEIDVEQQRGDSAPDASFGLRLERLRKERGHRQSDIASQLGVSKPTVWAWEHGKARPVPDRLDALAEVLGVSKLELLPGPNAPLLDELIARSREQIAAAVGTSAAKVKIWIEL